MQQQQIGTVAALFRYPVKSMLGEQLSEAAIGLGGMRGDRTWALRELVTGRIVSAKKWARMFEFRSSYETEPQNDSPVPAWITPPGGRKVSSDDPEASEIISAILGHKVALECVEPNRVSRAVFDPENVFGDTPLQQVLPVLEQYAPGGIGADDWQMPQGTFFDGSPLHLVSSSTLAHLARLRDESLFDARRFRPNFLIDTDSKSDGFAEDEWLDASLQIGSQVLVGITAPTIRCVMTTLAQGDLPRDPGVLRAAAKFHQGFVGVGATVLNPGRVRVGDVVTLVRQSA